MTTFECEAAFDENRYPFEMQFLNEYTTQMEAMHDNVYC